MKVFPLGPLKNFKNNEDPWLSDYPGPADNRFSYYHLINLANENKNSIGNAPDGYKRNIILKESNPQLSTKSQKHCRVFVTREDLAFCWLSKTLISWQDYPTTYW